MLESFMVFRAIAVVVQGDIAKNGQASKLATNNKSTIFVETTWDFDNKIYLWDTYTDQVSWCMVVTSPPEIFNFR